MRSLSYAPVRKEPQNRVSQKKWPAVTWPAGRTHIRLDMEEICFGAEHDAIYFALQKSIL
jgi:hypothetical protein